MGLEERKDGLGGLGRAVEVVESVKGFGRIEVASLDYIFYKQNGTKMVLKKGWEFQIEFV